MQHDFDITTADANTGATMRTQINAALQALATNSALTTEPGTKYPFMWWADTATDTLKQRNAANTAWVSVLKLSTGVAVAADFATNATNAVNATNSTNATNATNSTNAINATGAGSIPIARYENGLRIVRGHVDGNGDIRSGTGFTVSHPSAGNYTISFGTGFAAFSAAPTFVATISGIPVLGYSGAVWIASSVLSGSTVTVKIFEGTSNVNNFNFEFIAIGPN